MQRMLCIMGGMSAGGAETILMKIYRNLDRSLYQMDFAVTTDEKCFYDDEIEALGGRIFHIHAKTQKPLKNFCEIASLVRKEQYKCVLRASSNTLSGLDLLAAWMGGARRRVYRSTNSRAGNTKNALLVHKLCAFMPRLFANVRIAPSTEAAEHVFGKGCIEKGTAGLLHNAVDLSVFRYDEEGRGRVRAELGMGDGALLVGHVGRFAKQKNHPFLLEVFREIHARRPDAKLLLAGGGEGEEAVRRQAEALGLKDAVVFAGVRADIPAVLSAMDVFAFPSFYEGLPNTVVEAQACGLSCVIADTITREAAVTGLVEFLPLGDAKQWADACIARASEHVCTEREFIEKKYDIQSTVEAFVEYVFE